MRIFIKECKKILDVRILFLLAVFTVLYHQLFMEITSYPSGGQCTDSPYDIPFYGELVKEWGPTLKVSEFAKVEEKQKELEDSYSKIIAKNKVLAEAGIKDYAAMKQGSGVF